MKGVHGHLIVLALILTACSGQAPTATPSPAPTSEMPTAASTATSNVPTIEVGGVQIHDPKVTNPELFNLTNPDSPIVQFAYAFGIKPQDVGALKPELRTGRDGHQFIVLTTPDRPPTTSFDESGTPLLVAEKGENGGWIWNRVTLRKISDDVGMPIGTAVDLFSYKVNLAAEEFNVFTYVDVGMKSRERQQGIVNFLLPDAQDKFAANNKMMPIAQHLVWTETLPDWLKQGSFTDQQLIGILKQYINDVMAHYPDIKIWSVVNEAWLMNDPSLDFWYSKLGKDYIRIAFETARQANPSAILCYSDFGNEVPGKRATWNHEIAQTLNQVNLIDGLMMHMRIDAANPPQKDELIGMMKSYGVPIYISELTVDLTNVSGTQEDKFLKQAQVYETIMEAAIESGVTKAFVMWGIGDSSNWLETTVGRPNAAPTIYTDDYQPKPAYYALLQGMLKYAGQP